MKLPELLRILSEYETNTEVQITEVNPGASVRRKPGDKVAEHYKIHSVLRRNQRVVSIVILKK